MSVRAKSLKKISDNGRSQRAAKEAVTREELMEDMEIDMDDEE